MNGKLILGLFLLPLFTIANPNLNSSQLTQFETTGNCPGCELQNIQFLQTKTLGLLDLSNANLANTTFANSAQTQRQNSNFSGAFAPFVVYDNVDLSYSNFSNANISNGQFISTNFSGANFTGANISGANLSSTTLSNATISATQLASAGSLCNAILPDGKTKGKCSSSRG